MVFERRRVIELARSGERATCQTVQYQDNKFNTLIINFIQNSFGIEDCHINSNGLECSKCWFFLLELSYFILGHKYCLVLKTEVSLSDLPR